MDRLPAVRGLNRRALLRGSVAGLAALAGCRAPSRSSPPSHAPLYPPETVGNDPHAAVFALDFERLAAHADRLSDRTLSKYHGYVRTLAGPDLPVAADAVTRTVQLFPTATAPAPQAAVLHGAFETGRLHGALATRYATRSERGDARVYADPGGRAVAVDDGALLLGAPVGAPSGAAVVDALLDARDGGPRYAETNDAVAAVRDTLGDGADVSSRTHPPTPETDGPAGRFAGEVARGHRYRFRGVETDSRYAFAFTDTASAEHAATEGVQAWVDATDRLFEPYGAIDVIRENRTVVVDGTLPTDAV